MLWGKCNQRDRMHSNSLVTLSKSTNRTGCYGSGKTNLFYFVLVLAQQEI